MTNCARSASLRGLGLVAAVLCALPLAGCLQDEFTPRRTIDLSFDDDVVWPDAGTKDADADGMPADATPVDSAVSDLLAEDAPADAPDAAPDEDLLADAAPDAAAGDAAPEVGDAAPEVDAGGVDIGAQDLVSSDSGPLDVAAPDGGAQDAADASAGDAGPPACKTAKDCPDPGSGCVVADCAANGQCGVTNKPDGLPCQDGEICTAPDLCQGGACVSGAPNPCSDGNPCSLDACSPGVGCVHVKASGPPCDDGNPCTLEDFCDIGVCSHTALVGCDDGNACTTDGCDKAKGCVFANNSLPCSDGDGCTAGEKCAAGVCSGAKGCDSHAACSVGACVCAPGWKGNGFVCKDFDECAQPLACGVHAICANEPGTFACSCASGFDACGAASGCPVDLQTSVLHCGACGQACSANHTAPDCVAGQCSGACEAGWSDCNGDKLGDGCEVSILNDSAHCGGCGAACSASHIAPACQDGLCNGACEAGWDDCNGDKRSDGCEVNLATSLTNCGACGRDCGGPACAACGEGKPCSLASDCKSGNCSNGLCAPQGMAAIPAGTFWMGCNAAKDAACQAWADENPQHKVTLAAYFMDATETTVAQYKACVDAGACTAPAQVQPKPVATYPGLTNHPVNNLTWTQARQYCQWRGAGFDLPTEAQWEMAARGSCAANGAATDAACQAAMRTYPWGEAAPDCDLAVFSAGGVQGCGTAATWPVASKPAGDSPYGVHDLAGNVFEWTRDWYGASYGAADAFDPLGPASGSGRVYRGGGLSLGALALRTSSRFFANPASSSGPIGMRCVKAQ